MAAIQKRLGRGALGGLLDNLRDADVLHTTVLPPGHRYDDTPSDTGWVVFKASGEDIAVAPPFPVSTEAEQAGFVPDELLRQVAVECRTAIVLIRLGRFAIGVFQGTQLVSSKTETRYVGSQHKAGGWSQKRFARIREKQIRELFDKVCETAREKLSPHEGDIERLWLGGDRHVLNGFLERCQWMRRFADRTADYRLNVPTPDLAGLKKSIDDALAYRVIRTPTGSEAL